LAYGAVDPLQWGRSEAAVDFHDVKGDLESLLAPAIVSAQPVDHPALHPGRAASLSVDGRLIGVVGELHPRWRQAYELPLAPIVFELELDALLARPMPDVQRLPRHQPVLRDLALVVAETVSHDDLTSALRADPAGLVRSATLFDIYRPKVGGADPCADERSMAFRLEIIDDTANLTDSAIDAAVAAALARVVQATGARLRG
jgi:phenylalanyl-tRNA synthetase beta chain